MNIIPDNIHVTFTWKVTCRVKMRKSGRVLVTTKDVLAADESALGYGIENAFKPHFILEQMNVVKHDIAFAFYRRAPDFPSVDKLTMANLKLQLLNK